MALFGPPSSGLVVFATGWVVWVLSQVKSSLVVSSVAKSLCARTSGVDVGVPPFLVRACVGWSWRVLCGVGALFEECVPGGFPVKESCCPGSGLVGVFDLG